MNYPGAIAIAAGLISGSLLLSARFHRRARLRLVAIR